MLRVIVSATLAATILAGCGGLTREELLAQREAERFREILDRYTVQYFTDHPHRATEAGIHEYDGLLPALTREYQVQHTNQLTRTLNDLAELDTKRLSTDIYYDYQIFQSKLKAEVLEQLEIRNWMRNPSWYNELVSTSILSLTDSHFASPGDRLKSVISRLDKVPDLLATMKTNMENPAPIYVEAAKEEFAGTAGFLKNDLPLAFADVQDKALMDELKASIQNADKAYGEALKFLRDDLSRRARGGHSLGSKFFRQKLNYEELVETPIEGLVKMGEDEIRKQQDELKEAAARISPGRSVAQTLDSLAADYPKPEELVTAASTLTAELRKFVTEKDIVTVPPDPSPDVRALTPFTQGLLFARLDSPGPLENTTASSYTIAMPEASWPAVGKEQHRMLLNRAALPILSIHETYPGRYLQLLHARKAGSQVRKLFGSEAFRQGWAGYAEQMMLDEGYGNNDPKLRIAQLQFALVRAARFLASVRVHGQGTMDEKGTAAFFMTEAYLSRENAEREARRVALDPSVVSYTLGKLEILRLREDYRKARGAQFTLKDFHDNLLMHGYPPFKIVRQILLPNSDKP